MATVMKLPEEWNPWEKEMYALARRSGDMFMSMLKSFSGADQAEAQKYAEERLCYIDIAAAGADISPEVLEAILQRATDRWKAYALAQQAKVASAPKLKRGPSSGHSVISHRWVDVEGFDRTAIHVRAMVKIVKGRLAEDAAS